jgi:CheY-like chemotaxis protein
MTKPVILVVDDDPDIRMLLCELLAGEGYEAVGAADGVEALNVLRGIASPALLCIDLMMPRMDGTELIGAIKRDPALAAIPILVMSGHTVPGLTTKPAASAYLAKPFDLDVLLATVHRLADRALPG